MARIFVIEGREFDDPLPDKTVDEVRRYYATYFPELNNAETNQTKRLEDDIIQFTKRVGVKG